MDDYGRINRLRELETVIAEKKRYSRPQDAESKEWVMGHEQQDGECGDVVLRDIPVWYPKAECLEWHELTFPAYMPEPAVRALSIIELAELRQDMAEASAWARAELARRKSNSRLAQ